MTAKQQLLALSSHRCWSVTDLLNYLQEYGQISDNIVDWQELPECEAKRVLPWLKDFNPSASRS